MAACCRRGAGRGPARPLVPRRDPPPRLAGARAAPRSASPRRPCPTPAAGGMRETKRPLRGAAFPARRLPGQNGAGPGLPPREPRSRPAQPDRGSRPRAQSARRPAPGPARPGPARSTAASPGGPARPKTADCECPRPPRRWRRGRRREETDISFELKWSRFRSDHWPKRDTNLQCSPGWLPSPIGCLVGQKMAAKEPVPARSSTSRTRPPLPPPRAASLYVTPSLRDARARGHAPVRPRPRPGASEQGARSVKARGRALDVRSSGRPRGRCSHPELHAERLALASFSFQLLLPH